MDIKGLTTFGLLLCRQTQQLGRICKGVELFVGTQSILHLALRMHSGNDAFLNEQSNIAAQYLYDKILNPPPPTQSQNSGGTIY